jgi:hypothetical protein
MRRARRQHGPPQTSDQEVVLELFALADELTRLHAQTAHLATRLDALAGLIAERWQPYGSAVIDERY